MVTSSEGSGRDVELVIVLEVARMRVENGREIVTSSFATSGHGSARHEILQHV